MMCYRRIMQKFSASKGWIWLIGFYLKVLVAAVICACLSYQLITWMAGQVHWDWVQYLARKPLRQYVDRFRLICVCVGFIGVIRSLKLSWSRLGMSFCGKAYVKYVLYGMLLWLTLFLVTTKGLATVSMNDVCWRPIVGFLFASFLLAILEEFVFRGVLLNVFEAQCERMQATNILGLLFAFLHFSTCEGGNLTANIWIQGAQCALHSITSIGQHLQWTYFCCLFLLNALLVHIRHKCNSLWGCIGFHQGLIFTLMVLRKIFTFGETRGAFWGTGRLTDAWFTVLCLCCLYLLMRKTIAHKK